MTEVSHYMDATTRLRAALNRIQELVLTYESEDGRFPTNPAEEVLDEIDAICLSVLKATVVPQVADEGGD